MKSNLLRQAHRWIGLLFSLTILTSAGSGVLHTVMTSTQRPPPAARPTGERLAVDRVRVPVAAALATLPPGEVRAVNLRPIDGEPWYQVFRDGSGPPLYVSAANGRVDPHADARYAERIASAFLDGKPVRRTSYLTAFDAEYINIFRVLPAYRFDADDGLGTRVYVSTTTGSVTRHTDDRRQFEANVFTNLHKFGFIPNKLARDIALTTVTLGAFLVACLGVGLFFVTARPRSPRGT